MSAKKLFELKLGTRFEFIDKHRGKEFQVTYKSQHLITYVDVATGEERKAKSNREMFRKEVFVTYEHRESADQILESIIKWADDLGLDHPTLKAAKDYLRKNMSD